MMQGVTDIRYDIFRGCLQRRVTAVLTAEAGGVLSGIDRASRMMESLGLWFSSELCDGGAFDEGQEIARVMGGPVQIALAEDRIIGAVSKSSGIATVARRVREEVHPHCRVVSGGWKKMPIEIKDHIRKGAQDGGIDIRILPKPFVYLDKNYIRIFGGIKKAIQAVMPLEKFIVVQVRGETGRISDEAVNAAEIGVEVIMVDTGCQKDVKHVIEALKQKGLRSRVRVAFAGNITFEKLKNISRLDIDAVDIGHVIMDAPCLPMRFDVIDVV